MCDFKPGDEVVCVDAERSRSGVLSKGRIYTVSDIIDENDGKGLRVMLLNEDNGEKYDRRKPWWGFRPSRFRKVIRKNDSLPIEAFLTIKPGFEEKDAFPVKKRERV